MPILLSTWQLSLFHIFPMLQSCRQGIQEYINETHRKQAAAERKGWESSHVCYWLALSALCTWSNMEKKGLWPNSLDSALLYTAKADYFYSWVISVLPEAEERIHNWMNSYSWTFLLTLHSVHLKINGYFFFNKSSESCKGSLKFTVVSFFPLSFTKSKAKQELTGWKWISRFQRKGCGILEQ